MVVVDHKEVVEVSADLNRRIHNRVNVKLVAVREGREVGREHILLDARRQTQLRTDTFSFRRDSGQILDILGNVVLHVRHGQVQLFEFVSAAYVEMLEVVILR